MTHRSRSGPFGDGSRRSLDGTARAAARSRWPVAPSLLRGAGVAGMALSSSGLLAACGTEGAKIDAGECASTDLSDEEKTIVFSNWIGYVDPVKKADTSTLEKFQEETGITVDLPERRRQRQRDVLRQGVAAAPGVQVDRARRLRGDRLHGRPDDRAGLDPEARPREHAQRRRQPDRLPEVARLGPRARVQRPVAERHDRHLLQLRAHRPGHQLRGAAHPARPQGQGRAADRDARHDAVPAADGGQRPRGLHRRRVHRGDRRACRRSSTAARSAASPATTTSTT